MKTMPRTSSKYTGYLISNYLETRNLLNLAQANKHMFRLCLDEKYFEYRICNYYGQAWFNKKDYFRPTKLNLCYTINLSV